MLSFLFWSEWSQKFHLHNNIFLVNLAQCILGYCPGHFLSVKHDVEHVMFIWKNFWVGLVNISLEVCVISSTLSMIGCTHHGDTSSKRSRQHSLCTMKFILYISLDWPDVAPFLLDPDKSHPSPVCRLFALAHSHAESGLTYSWPRPEIAYRQIW